MSPAHHSHRCSKFTTSCIYSAARRRSTRLSPNTTPNSITAPGISPLSLHTRRTFLSKIFPSFSASEQQQKEASQQDTASSSPEQHTTTEQKSSEYQLSQEEKEQLPQDSFAYTLEHADVHDINWEDFGKVYDTKEEQEQKQRLMESFMPHLICEDADSHSRKLFLDLVDNFLEKWNIDEQLNAHFDALKRYESGTWKLNQFLEQDEFDFEDAEDNLTAYLKVLSLMYGTHGNQIDMQQVRHMLKELADKDYAPALESLAILLYDDADNDNSFEEAMELHKRGAELGFIESYLNYGSYLMENFHLAGDDELHGLRLVTQAANEGSVAAMEVLARTFCFGSSIIQSDPNLSYNWAKVATDYGSIEGPGYMGMQMLKGVPDVPFNPKKALELIKISSDAGVADMRALYAVYLVNQEDNLREGIPLLKQCVEQEYCLPPALYHMSLFCLDGYGVPQDIPKGLEYAKRAADLDDESSLYLLGSLYETGLRDAKHPIMPDIEKAIEYHRKNVMKHGNRQSRQALDRYKEMGVSEMDSREYHLLDTEKEYEEIKARLYVVSEKDRPHVEQALASLKDQIRDLREGMEVGEEILECAEAATPYMENPELLVEGDGMKALRSSKVYQKIMSEQEKTKQGMNESV